RAAPPQRPVTRQGGAAVGWEPGNPVARSLLVAPEGLKNVGRDPVRSGTRNVDRISSYDRFDFRGRSRLGRQRREPGSVSHIKTLDDAQVRLGKSSQTTDCVNRTPDAGRCEGGSGSGHAGSGAPGVGSGIVDLHVIDRRTAGVTAT